MKRWLLGRSPGYNALVIAPSLAWRNVGGYSFSVVDSYPAAIALPVYAFKSPSDFPPVRRREGHSACGSLREALGRSESGRLGTPPGSTGIHGEVNYRLPGLVCGRKDGQHRRAFRFSTFTRADVQNTTGSGSFQGSKLWGHNLTFK